jgi:hypothetical protein
VDGNDDEGKLSLIPTPWTAARDLLGKLSSDANLLRPGAAVTVAVDIGEIRFAEKDEATKLLTDAVHDRVKADQLTIADGQPLVLRVKYAESQGQTLQEFKQEVGKPRINPMGTATGKSVEATKAVIELSWTDASGQKVYWKHRHGVDQTSVYVTGELTREAVRKQVFDGIISSIAMFPLPYYLTSDPKGPQLPLVHRLPRWN